MNDYISNTEGLQNYTILQELTDMKKYVVENAVKGDSGPSGPQGPAGATGPQGPQGAAGTMGPQGPAGKDGANGTNGVTPDISATAQITTDASGATSVNVTKSGTDVNPAFDFNFKNLKGEKGDTGATGPQGPQGPTGPTGPSGGISDIFVVAIQLSQTVDGTRYESQLYAYTPKHFTSFDDFMTEWNFNINIGSIPSVQGYATNTTTYKIMGIAAQNNIVTSTVPASLMVSFAMLDGNLKFPNFTSSNVVSFECKSLL